jgi:hypothetical protein
VTAYLWVDPPGARVGWLYELPGGGTEDEVAAALANHAEQVPADNEQLQETYDRLHAGAPVAFFQAHRPHWGVTLLLAPPSPIPVGMVVVSAQVDL